MRALAVSLLAFGLLGLGALDAMTGTTSAAQSGRIDAILAMPRPRSEQDKSLSLQLLRQDFESLEVNRSILKTPLTIGSRRFSRGIGTHAVSHIRVQSPEPLERFTAWIGVDANPRTKGGLGSVVFVVQADGRDVHRSGVVRGGEEAERIDVPLNGSRELHLRVTDGDDGPACDHADWAEAAILLEGGRTVFPDEIKPGETPEIGSRYPFSFTYGNKLSDDLLDGWHTESRSEKIDADRTTITRVWADPETGLRVHWEAVRYSDFPALDWILHFENAGKADTPIIADIQAMDLAFRSPMPSGGFRLHCNHGGTPDKLQFEPRVIVLDGDRSESIGAGCGRSSTLNFPFFKLETGEGSFVVAVGWSGNWKAQFDCQDAKRLRVTAGMEKTHFVLHPGEKVRSPRILVLQWTGDALEASSQFRRLIYKHYAAKRDGKTPLPILFCNTAFTRGGGWLNECNAENQISLIKAYAPLGLEALITDAGWFEGGWPEGAGNWNPRKDAYPNGMAPVAAAAQEHGMVYGLWFEPERVVAGTTVQVEHPDWCLASQKEPQGTYLLNFGLPEVQDYFFNIVKGFMELPGFRFYRQDFNMDPLPYWRHNDAPDRQGITEIKYIEGLYAYWDRIARTWPDSIREECASGGHRIDLETVIRMHSHQTTDYWFDDDVNQAALWAFSAYLPNGCATIPINRLDDYSFHSALASSLIPGWIADAPDFDRKRGKELLDIYRRVRHLLIGAYYPLLPYTRSANEWMAMQYHRPDLNEGIVLAFRHAESAYRTTELSLRGLEPDATYELEYVGAGKKTREKGKSLMSGHKLTLPERRSSVLILYSKKPR